MSQAASKLNQLGLDDAEYRRLVTWMPEIAAELSPGAPVRGNGNETRVGRKGSLVVYDDGGWHSYEADEGGRGPRSLIEYLRPGIGAAEARQMARAWLLTHAGTGSADSSTDSDARDRDTEQADFCRMVLNVMEPGNDTPAALYLQSRGLGTGWPLTLVGYIADDERPGEGAIVGVISDVNGAPAGIQLGYLDTLGHKLTVGGTDRRQFLIDRTTPGLGFRTAPAKPDATLPLLLVEGLENALTLALAYPAAEIIGLPGIGRMRRLPAFRGRDIVVFRDGDAADSPASRTLMAGVDHLLIGGANVQITKTPPQADANSILQEGGITTIQALVESAAPATLSPKGIVRQCATLNELDYQLARRQQAKSIGIKLSALDQQVAMERARRRGEDDGAPAEDNDIHPEPVTDIGAVLDTARQEVGQYVVADPMQLDMAVMWALHTHFVHHPAIDLAISPRLLVGAPAPECGKTTLMEATGELSARPLELSSISPAAFFRLNDAERPTLLIDEIQGLLGRKGNNAEFEAILNASHRRRSAKTVRVEEQANKKLVPIKFDSWGTFAATMSGRMSYAMESRCLKVTMRRALSGEVKKHLQDGTSEVLVECRRKFARWAQDQLGLPDVLLPPVLANRRGDNWRPLFRIAAPVGGHWPKKIEAAALAAMGQTVSVDVIVAFLTDAREIIGTRDHILTTELIEALRSLEDPSWDWNTGHRGGPVNAYWLRDKLADVLDPPGTKEFKRGSRVRRGYEACQFNDAYERYLKRHNPSEHIDPEQEIHRENSRDSHAASASSATDTNKLRKTRDIYSVADGSEGSLDASATRIDPLPNTVSGSGSTSVADPNRDRFDTSATDKSLGNNKGEPFQYRMKRINGGKTPHSRSIPQKSASEPQPDGEEVDELW